MNGVSCAPCDRTDGRAVGHPRAAHTPERKAAEENSTSANWNEFYRKIEVRGPEERSYTEEEVDNWLAGLSEEETWALVGKLKCMRNAYAFPRAMQSVLRDVFYLVETARWHLKQDGRSPQWRAEIALHMYQLRTVLQQAAEAAEHIEKATGFSGKELAEA